MKKKMETKFNETIISTSDLKEMSGKYLSERLTRKWSEDFADEDTGETVSIERNELILDKGTFIGTKELTEINFHIQSGDVVEVSVSNQKRTGRCTNGFTSVWSITVKNGNKKKTFLLYANSIHMAIEIITDYLEQSIEGTFTYTSIKELDYSNLIPLEEEEDLDFYKIEIEVEYEGDGPINHHYILQANDAEDAKKRIVDFISVKAENENRSRIFTTTIISAKTISINSVVDYQFSKQYLERLCHQ